MDYVLGKVKRLKKNPIKKVASDVGLFDDVDFNPANQVEFSAGHLLDEDAWFKVDRFSTKSFCPDWLKRAIDSKDYNDLKKAEFGDLTYLASVQGGNVYFQKLTPSQFLRRKTVSFGDSAVVEDSSTRLVINKLPDAIFFKNEDVLVFRSIATISSIFDGIDQLYREATREETEKFLKGDFIELKNNFGADKVSKPNRKRLALALDTLSKLSAVDKKQLLGYVDSYCNNKLVYDNQLGMFEIKSDEELKLLLYGIEQRFYTTLLGQEKRIANSVQALH